MSRETLSTLLWGEMDDQSAKKNLRNAVYTIRKSTFDYLIISLKRYVLQLNDKYKVTSDIETINSFNLMRF